MVSELKTVPIVEPSCLCRYRRIIRLVKTCARICGADVTERDYQMNWITYTIFMMIFIFYCCAAYTIDTKIRSDGNYQIILQITCFVFAALQSTVKLICFILERFQLREAQMFLDGTYEKYEKKGVGYQNVLLESIAVTWKGIKLFAAIYICAMLTCCGFPIIHNIIYDDKLLIMQYLLPGLDPSTNHGYWLLTFFHVTILGVGAFGNFATDMYLLTFVGSMPLLKNILRCKFEDLNRLLSRDVQFTERKVREAMVDIVLWHEEYLRLLSCAEQVFYLIIFAHVFCSVASLTSTTYCMLIGIFPAAPFFMLLSLANLYLYCGLGTLVDKSNDECIEIIYTHCDWYNLPISEQRFVLLMLRKSQATDSLSVGNLMPLTVGTALDLTKAFYSMLMLLLSNRD